MNNQLKGLLFIICGTVLWGAGGTIAQVLFIEYGLNVNDYVKMRLLVSGVLLLLLATLKRQDLLAPFKNKVLTMQIIIYGLFGMLAVQYTFMAAIHAGNAATATLLQYLAPVVILIFYLLTKQKRFRIRDFMIVTFSMFGTMLLLTNGSFSSLTVSTEAIIWGVLSAVTAAFYILYASRLFQQLPSLTVVGYAMLIGAIGMFIIHPTWTFQFNQLDARGTILISISIIFGTTLAFWIYLESIKYIKADIVALLGCLEPLTSVILSAVWLGVSFGGIQIGGMLIILVIVIYASLKQEDEQLEVPL